jgi:tetratricopeptide (TPR) repeat protein
MSNNLIDEAEFLLHLAEEKSITRLRRLLQGASAELALPVLRRINQLYNGNNAELLLSLAIRSFHQGQDNEAMSFAKLARELRPDDNQVLCVALFLAAARGETEDALIVSQRLLDLYPGDEWARTMDSKLRQEEIVSSLSLPPLQTEWERLSRMYKTKAEISFWDGATGKTAKNVDEQNEQNGIAFATKLGSVGNSRW